MGNSAVISRANIKIKAVIAVSAIIIAVALPQVFHAIGIVSGTGAAAGAAFLPMHLPVILAGLIGGPAVGLLAGVLSPLISFAISGMPTATLLPFMLLELAGYGIAAGLLKQSKLPVFAKLLIVQISGRIVRAAAVLTAVYVIGSETAQLASIYTMITAGLFGIALQWALIPLIMYRIKGIKKLYD